MQSLALCGELHGSVHLLLLLELGKRGLSDFEVVQAQAHSGPANVAYIAAKGKDFPAEVLIAHSAFLHTWHVCCFVSRTIQPHRPPN